MKYSDSGLCNTVHIMLCIEWEEQIKSNIKIKKNFKNENLRPFFWLSFYQNMFLVKSSCNKRVIESSEITDFRTNYSFGTQLYYADLVAKNTMFIVIYQLRQTMLFMCR